MIKPILDSSNYYHSIYCDSCFVKIANCCDFEFMSGQELIYSPILCEKCGTDLSKNCGELVSRVEQLEKELKELRPPTQ